MIPLNCATSKTPVWCKNFGDISYISRDISNLVLKFTNFRYHGNKGRCGYISMMILNSATPKTPIWSTNLDPIYYTALEMANLVLKFTNFRYHGNKGRSKVNFRDTVKFRDLEYPMFCLLYTSDAADE